MIQMKRKIRQGYVIRANQSKTVIVAVERWYKHQLYGKAMRRTKKYYVHDNGQICKVGDLVKYGPHFGIITEIIGKRWGGICADWCMVYFNDLDVSEMIHPDTLRLA